MYHAVLYLRALTLLAVGSVLLAGCAAQADGPAIEAIRPGAVAPGGMVLLSGRGFAREDVVWVAGRELPNVSWVNGGLLAITIPADVPEGTHTLELRSASGQRISVPVQVAPASAAGSAANPPSPAASPLAPTVTVTPGSPLAPTPSPAVQVPTTPTRQPASLPRGDGGGDKDDKKDDKKDSGRGNSNQGEGGNGRGR